LHRFSLNLLLKLESGDCFALKYCGCFVEQKAKQKSWVACKVTRVYCADVQIDSWECVRVLSIHARSHSCWHSEWLRVGFRFLGELSITQVDLLEGEIYR